MPGANGKELSAATLRRSGVMPGLMPNATPSFSTRVKSAGLRIVPMPTTASGTSAIIALAASIATGVRMVTSSVRTPPATSARASGTASWIRSMVRTGMTVAALNSAARWFCWAVVVILAFVLLGRLTRRRRPVPFLRRHCITRNDGAGIADHEAGEAVPGLGGLDRIGTGKPRSDIGRRKAVAGRCGVDHGFGHGLGADLVGPPGKAQQADRLGEPEHQLGAWDARHQLLAAFAGIESEQILGRSQHDVGSREGRRKHLARDIAIRPSPRAEIGVEHKAGAEQARALDRREQALAPGRVVDRERDRREIDDVVAHQRVEEIVRLRQVHQLARRRTVAPVEELALSLRIQLDHVEAGQLARQPRDAPRADALRSPGRDHLIAQGIVAKRGEIIDLDLEPREVHGRVESVAAESTRVEAPALPAGMSGGLSTLGLPELDHAFADASNARHHFTRSVRDHATKLPPSSSSM